MMRMKKPRHQIIYTGIWNIDATFPWNTDITPNVANISVIVNNLFFPVRLEKLYSCHHLIKAIVDILPTRNIWGSITQKNTSKPNVKLYGRLMIVWKRSERTGLNHGHFLEHLLNIFMKVVYNTSLWIPFKMPALYGPEYHYVFSLSTKQKLFHMWWCSGEKVHIFRVWHTTMLVFLQDISQPVWDKSHRNDLQG